MDLATQSPGSDALPRRRVGPQKRGFRRPLASVTAFLDCNAFLIFVLAGGAAGLAAQVRSAVQSDTWYSLLAGRIIVRSGLPGSDKLAVLTAGRQWVDQQWLAHLGLYGLWVAGGWPLATLSEVVLYVGAFAVLAATGRRLGASDRSTALVAALCFLTGISNTELRAQLPAYLLFAIVFSLLLTDERRASNRVFLVFPLLIVWANVHGSVVFGALLVALRGLTFGISHLNARRGGTVREWLPRAAALLFLPWLCLLASPYAFELPGYYRRVLDNGALDQVVPEWGPTTLRNQTLFFVLLLIGLWLVFRNRNRTTVFAQLAFLGAAVTGLYAVRYVVWFALLAAAVLPSALDSLWTPANAPRRRRVNLVIAGVGIAAAVIVGAATATHNAAWFEHAYPRAAIRAIARSTRSNPRLRVYASDRYADWLLFEDPSLAGRVAYDDRLELLTGAQLSAIAAFRDEAGQGWQNIAAGYGLLVLNASDDEGLIETFERIRGNAVLFRNDGVVAIRRGKGRHPF